MILQSMRNITFQERKASKSVHQTLITPKMKHRKDKIVANSQGFQGGIQRPKMPTSSFLHYYHANKKTLAEQWG
jgi:hypothetical protein